MADFAYRDVYHRTCAQGTNHGVLIGSVLVKRLLAEIGLKVFEDFLGLEKDNALKQFTRNTTDSATELPCIEKNFSKFFCSLVQAPEYEIRLVALEYLYSIAKACLTEKDKHGDRSAREGICWKYFFAHQDETILKELFRMVVDTEANQDCLTKVCFYAYLLQ